MDASLAAQHSGAINHHHTFSFSSSTVDALREVKLIVSLVVVGWIATTALRGFGNRNSARE